jgi:type IV pilus assembly protein PilY1
VTYRKFLFPPALVATSNKIYVAVGSGDREHPLSTQYPYQSSVTNRFYVLLDDLSVRSTSSASAVDMDGDTMRNFTTATNCNEAGVLPSGTDKGWYIDFTGRGEQTITSAIIAGGMVAFNTNRATPASGSVCTNPLGEARGYWMNLFNASGAIGNGNASCGGDRFTTFVGGGLTPSPTIATVVIDGKVETVAIGAAQRSGGASSGIAPQRVEPTISSKRRTIYWRSNKAD